jgi:hypothetical protein
MIRPDRHFGLSGWLFTAGMAYGLLRFVKDRARPPAGWTVLVLYAGPFAAVWWRTASYEPRFLMAILPVLATMAALTLDDVWIAAGARLSGAGARMLRWAAVAATAAATVIALRQTVEHKGALLRGWQLDDAAKHRIRLGGLYDLAVAMNHLPAASRVTGAPAMVRFHLDAEHFAQLDWTPRSAPPDSFADRYDYVAYQPARTSRTWEDTTPAILRTGDGYALFATHPLVGARGGTSGSE